MINSNKIHKRTILTKKEFNNYFYDMLLTIFNAKLTNSNLVFDNNEKFEINAYLD